MDIINASVTKNNKLNWQEELKEIIHYSIRDWISHRKNVLSSGNKQYVHAMYSINNNNPCPV